MRVPSLGCGHGIGLCKTMRVRPGVLHRNESQPHGEHHRERQELVDEQEKKHEKS